MLRSLVFIFLLFSCSTAFAQDNFDVVQDSIDKAHESSKDFDSVFDKTLKKVEELRENETIRSSVEALKDVDDTSFGKVPWKEELSRLNDTGQLLVFVSFSMDDDLLRDYMEEASLFGARLVLRGIKDGDMGEAMSKMSSLMEGFDDNSPVQGISIDPRGFDLHDIKLVPSIVLSEKSYELCQTDPCVDVGNVDVMTGAVTLRYALEQFSKSGDNRALAKTILR